MTRAFDLGAGATLSAKVKFDIEFDWDYAYLVVSDRRRRDLGQASRPICRRPTIPNGQNFGYGITGSVRRLGRPDGGPLGVRQARSCSASATGPMRFVTYPGFMVDDIEVTGYPVDGAEDGGRGWTLSGFLRHRRNRGVVSLQRVRRGVPSAPRLRPDPRHGLQLHRPGRGWSTSPWHPACSSTTGTRPRATTRRPLHPGEGTAPAGRCAPRRSCTDPMASRRGTVGSSPTTRPSGCARSRPSR